MKTKSKEENLVYIKLSCSELTQSKKEILSIEINLIKILQIIKNYKFLRMQELKSKIKLLKKLKETRAEIKRFEQTLPKSQISKRINGNKTETKKEKFLEKVIKNKNNLESQLQEIQKKLKNLE
jgi:hypothetical protein